MLDLKARFGDTYRIALDESASIPGQSAEDRAWLRQIPAKFGHVYPHGAETLGAFVRTGHDSTDRLGRLLAIPGARLHQRGDREATVTFAPGHLPLVAEILRAKRRRRLSEGHRARLVAAGSRHRFPPGSNG